MKVLKFGAIWCTGCIVMKPIWVEIEKENDWLKTEYFDVDENKDLVNKYEIKDFPCFIFLDSKNDEVHREYGQVEKAYLQKIINNFKDK